MYGEFCTTLLLTFAETKVRLAAGEALNVKISTSARLWQT